MKKQISYDKLWKLMIDKKINKSQLIQEAEITSNAMAKLGKNETVQLETLLKICEVLECGIEDIVEFTADEEGDNKWLKLNQNMK